MSETVLVVTSQLKEALTVSTLFSGAKVMLERATLKTVSARAGGLAHRKSPLRMHPTIQYRGVLPFRMR